MPMDRKRYPNDWDAISKRIRARADGRCECRGECGHDHARDAVEFCSAPELVTASPRCPALQGCPNPVTGRTVILTVAHLDHTPANCEPENLRAMCQRCHLSYDRDRHIAKSRATRRARKAAGDLFE